MRYLLLLSLLLVGCAPQPRLKSASSKQQVSAKTFEGLAVHKWKRGDGLRLEFTVANLIVTELDGTKLQLTYSVDSYRTGNELWITQLIPPQRAIRTRFYWEISTTELLLTVAHAEDINDDMAKLAGRYEILPETPAHGSITEAEEKLRQCQEQRKHINELATKLDADRAQLVSKLRGKGIKIFDDLDHQSVLLGREIVEIDDHLAFLRDKGEKLASAGLEIESILRRLQRFNDMDSIKSVQTNVEQEVQKLSAIRIDLDERFEPAKPVGDARAAETVHKVLFKLVPVNPPRK